MKKALFISYDGMTDPLGQSQVLPYLVELSRKGYRFTILSFEKRNRYEAERNVIESITKEASINWVPLFFTSKPPLLSKMYDRWQLLHTASRLHKEHKFDVIHCRSYMAAEAGLLLKRKTGVKFLFDMRGFWADEKVDCGQWDQRKMIYRRIYRHYKNKEQQFLTEADAIVSLTQAAKDVLLSKPLYKDLDIQVIPCCADLDLFDFHKVPASLTTELKAQLGIPPGKQVITYLGSIGGWYMTDEMFTFYKRLLKAYPDYVMLVLTKDDPETVLNEAAESGIPGENIFVRFANRKEIAGCLSMSDWSIFFIRPTFSKTASSPTKHAELMSMGIPVVCNDIGDTGYIIEATQSGVVIKDFSENAYDEAVKQMISFRDMPKENIRKAAFDFFDLKKGALNYEELYRRILNESD